MMYCKVTVYMCLIFLWEIIQSSFPLPLQLCYRPHYRCSARLGWRCDPCCAYLRGVRHATQYHEDGHRRSRCHQIPTAAPTKGGTQVPHNCRVWNCQDYQRGETFKIIYCQIKMWKPYWPLIKQCWFPHINLEEMKIIGSDLLSLNVRLFLYMKRFCNFCSLH